jgi:hypothetical protein
LAGLPGDSQAMQLGQLLRCQRRTEVAVALSDEPHGLRLEASECAIVARSASPTRYQPGSAISLVRSAHPSHLALAEAHQRGGLRPREPVLQHTLHHLAPIDFLGAHGDQDPEVSVGPQSEYRSRTNATACRWRSPESRWLLGCPRRFDTSPAAPSRS